MVTTANFVPTLVERLGINGRVHTGSPVTRVNAKTGQEDTIIEILAEGISGTIVGNADREPVLLVRRSNPLVRLVSPYRMIRTADQWAKLVGRS